jgi:Predicted small integral membrane protein (DUF2165)
MHPLPTACRGTKLAANACRVAVGEPAMIVMRVAKIIMVAAIALFATLVSFSNLTDYWTNFAFVQHVLSMDTIFPNSESPIAPSPAQCCITWPMPPSLPRK